ncbi:aBC transporter membrane protein [Mycoplasma sp. CAG:956]|nr:aBC transporter membrane protein [Mycoplasma sp. CAG:956]
MNKLLVKEGILSINNSLNDLDIKTNTLTLEISGNVCINDINNNTDLDLKIIMSDGSHLLYNRYNESINKFNLNIEITSNAYVEFNYSLKTLIASDISLNANIAGNNNISHINFHGITDQKGVIKNVATSKVDEATKDNEVLENLRIVTLNDAENMIVPNLLVRSDSVNAIHNTTISTVDKDYLFYLNSKGINKKDATKLIVDGFLKSNLKENN